MRKLTTLTIIIVTTLTILNSCGGTRTKPSDNNIVDSTFLKTLTEKQIGKSEYYFSIPKNYSLKETAGEDFSVYYFYPTDTVVKQTFSGGLYFGNHPHKIEPKNDSCKTELLKGLIMNSNSDWTLYNCNDSYFIQTIVDSKSTEGWNQLIHAFGRATSKQNLTKLQDIYSTIKRKR